MKETEKIRAYQKMKLVTRISNYYILIMVISYKKRLISKWVFFYAKVN